MKKTLLTALAIACIGGAAHAQVYITEFFYQGGGTEGDLGFEHEFFELTNTGATTVDVTGWYYRDSTENPAEPFSLSPFGSIAPGESVIVTDISEEDFRLVWTTLDAGVRVLGDAVPGLGRSDTIRIFDSGNVLVDQLAYGDNTIGGERFRFITGITSPGNLGQNDIFEWVFSNNPAGWFDGIAMNNLTSINGDIANPGYTNFEVVPEPSTVAMLALAFGAGALFHLRRRARLG